MSKCVKRPFVHHICTDAAHALSLYRHKIRRRAERRRHEDALVERRRRAEAEIDVIRDAIIKRTEQEHQRQGEQPRVPHTHFSLRLVFELPLLAIPPPLLCCCSSGFETPLMLILGGHAWGSGLGIFASFVRIRLVRAFLKLIDRRPHDMASMSVSEPSIMNCTGAVNAILR